MQEEEEELMVRRRKSMGSSFLVLVMMLTTILLPFGIVTGSKEASAHEGEEHKVLVVTKTTGFRHASIDQGAKIALPEMGKKYGFKVDFTESAADINAANLANYDVIFFANTTGNFSDWGFTAQQKTDLMDFIKSGKGYVGAHAATDTGYDWAEYGEMTGAYFTNHPWTQEVRFTVEDDNHPATSHLGQSWTALEEVYYFRENPRDKGKHILLSLDMDSVGGNKTEDHPNAWCSPVDKGRMFYTALGHHPETWFNDDFQKHLLGGLQYAWGEANNTGCGTPSVKPGLQKVSITKSISMPVGLDIAKDSKIYAISLLGKVYEVTQEGDTKEILSLPTTLEGEHGLMGIALDPDFDTNKYIYLYYTNPKKTNDNKLINHLSRFTYTNGMLDPSSEQKLLDVPSDPTCCHQAGYITFGPDGKLYLTAGDNRLPTSGPQIGSFETSQNLDDYRGKVLRINKDGSAPTDNPFFTDNNQRDVRDYIYAYGFRNPYRISFETKQDGKMVIYEGDVGPDGTFNNGAAGDHDELNAITAPGQNFGWPYGIGDTAYNSKIHTNATYVKQIDDTLYAQKFAETKKPIAFYPYTSKAPWGSGGRTAMAGPVYNYTGPNAIPGLQGKFLAYEFTRNWIKAITTDNNGEVVKVEDFTSGLLAPIDVKLGPDGALYVAEFGSSWEADENESITKIFYGKLERKPVVKAGVSATSGKAPLEVEFNTNGTTDPDGDALTYLWDFGDGNTSTEANPTHTYTANGNFAVTLTVTDTTGKFSVWNTSIVVGNTAPEITITSPSNGVFFTNGDTVTLTATAVDEEDGVMPCENIKWSVLLLHDAHYHPFDPAVGCQASFKLFDEGHGPEARISWQIVAEVTDNGAPGAAPLKASDSITFRNKRVQAEDFEGTGGNNGVKNENTSDVHGGLNVGYTDANDWMMFKNIDMTNISKMYFRMASDSAPIHMEMRLDSPTGEKVAELKAPTTKGWQNWKTFATDVTHTPHTVTAAVYKPEADINITEEMLNKEAAAIDKETAVSVTDVVYDDEGSLPELSKQDNSVTNAVYADFHDIYLVFPEGGNNINWLQFASAGDPPPSENDVCNKDCSVKYDTTGALSRTNWVPTASHGSNVSTGGTPPDDPKSCLACAIDGDMFSRWTTGAVMKAGMWYQVDLGSVQPISRVLVDFGALWTTSQQSKHPDYFRGYNIKVSEDGTNWTSVASAASNTQYVVDRTFDAVNARYVRVENTADDTTNSWWASIHELYVFPGVINNGWIFTHSTRGPGDDANNPSNVNHVIDGKLNTRWDTGEFQKPGQWFQVNMRSVKMINEVIIDASGHKDDYPRGYKIEVSDNGNTWKQVAVNANNSDVKVVAKFKAVKAQYVKITQTGSSSDKYWSIDELGITETTQPIELDAALRADIAGSILEAGDEVKITVSALNADKLYAGKMTLNYDASKFEYVNTKINGQFGQEGQSALLTTKSDPGKLTMVLTNLGSAPAHSGDVALVDVTFKVKADGNATLLKGSEFSSIDGELAQLNQDRTISIMLTNPDVVGDHDGLHINDLVAIAKLLGIPTFDPRFDMNHDGMINIEDIAYVARKLLEAGQTIR